MRVLFATAFSLIFILTTIAGILNLIIAAQESRMVEGIVGVGWLLVAMIALALIEKVVE